MTASGKLSKTLAALAAATLALTACSSDEPPEDEADAADQLDTLLAADARDDQQAAGGATATAIELGFDQVQAVSDDDIDAVRENAAEREGQAEEMTVNPQSCAAPIAQLDWSPILASSDEITRVDFGTANFLGAGSVEVAGISEGTGGSEQAAAEVSAHQQAVEEVTTNCNDLRMMLADESEPDWAELEYAFTAEPIDTDTGAGLRWQRYPTEDSEGQTTTALTLMTEHQGYAIMVAFIGSEEITDDEFTEISDAILASATAQLD